MALIFKMSELFKKVESLKKSNIKNTIDQRIKEFKEIGKKNSKEIFKELCFCLMTANFNAEKSIKIQNTINNGFLNLPEEELTASLKKLGHRFPNTRAKFIVEARKYKDSIKEILNSFNSETELREFLVKNIKGISYKESSHFLRNIGFENFAIIDFHILDLLAENNLIEKPKSKALTKNKYIEIENILKDIGKELNLNMAELDLYLWFIETGKILK